MKSFQVDRNKYTKGMRNIYKKERRYNKTRENQSSNDKLRDGFKKWTSFYRANPHRFAVDYFGMNLHLFQRIMIYMMFRTNLITIIAARGLGKSFLVAVFAIIRCILFPGTMIVIASGGLCCLGVHPCRLNALMYRWATD